MTATPKRDVNVDTYDYFGDPLYTYSLAQGIEDGFLAPYRVRRVVLSPDTSGWSPTPGQVDRFGRGIPPGLYETRHFERVVSLLARTGAAAKHLTEYMRRSDPMAKTIVFCVDSEHAEQMRQALNNANVDLARQYPNYAVRIVSDEGGVGREHLGDFADPERLTPVIATTSQLLSTGVDLPTVRNIVLFKPIGSMVEFKQIIGRGTRLYPDDGKLTFDIIDYTGATALFADAAFDGPPEAPPIVDDVDEAGEVVDTTDDEAEEVTDDGDGEDATPDMDENRMRKFYVDEGEAFVAAEGVYFPDASDGRLRLVEYRDYLADQTRRLFARPVDVHAAWRTGPGREELAAALLARGISLDEAAQRLHLEEMDPLDLLIHVAWNHAAVTRRDRTRRVRADEQAFFETFTPAAVEILDELLDKYAAFGIAELDDLRVLETSPLSEHGNVIEIAALFGGPAALQSAVDQLKTLLYSA